MQAASNAGTLQWLLLSVLAAGGHETRHLVLGELNLAATEGRETDVSDLELVCGGRHCEETGIRSETERGVYGKSRVD